MRRKVFGYCLFRGFVVHACTSVVVEAARRVKLSSLAARTTWLAKMVDWDVSWGGVIGKAREDWEVMMSAGTSKFDERLMQVR